MNKADLRKYYLEKRNELTAEEVAKKSLLIKSLLFSRLMMHRYDKVHCYLPIKKRNEVDTTLIINTLLKDFPLNIYVPQIHKQGILTHHLFKENTVTEENKWGVPEPSNEGISSEAFFATDDDILVIIPLLACDKTGNRVGYGKGYYDRFLEFATENTQLVGLSFFEPEELIKGTADTDIPLNNLITWERVYSF
jgi:5-formyltetrahydrofolate cyclo-ligase